MKTIIKFNAANEHGIHMFKLEGDSLSHEKISGKDITWDDVVTLFLTHPAFAEFRKAASRCSRKYTWNVEVRNGRSGCRDLTIAYLKDDNIVRYGGSIHISMNGKFSINRNSIWVKDLYDIIYWCAYKYTNGVLAGKLFEAFKASDSEFTDLTSQFELNTSMFRQGMNWYETTPFSSDSAFNFDKLSPEEQEELVYKD